MIKSLLKNKYKMEKLSLKIIESYNFPKSNYNPDWDDSGYKFTLPSGIVVSGLYRCNNSPKEMDMLEGLDGYICIETEDELKKLVEQTYEETLKEIKSKNPKFKIEDYL